MEHAKSCNKHAATIVYYERAAGDTKVIMGRSVEIPQHVVDPDERPGRFVSMLSLHFTPIIGGIANPISAEPLWRQSLRYCTQ
ncbi:unnamed protein product [Toxocara canis]|uniref:COesterase domain-containing protein n=1 Tax=Toxocara canis TaxID=6265 RepID=A0A183UM74_TOXCA|nr:unnamed protein product [Toxocara canis]